MKLVSCFKTDQEWAMDVYPLKVGMEANCFLVSELIRSIRCIGIGKLVPVVRRHDTHLCFLWLSQAISQMVVRMN
jgi:hypothetical protein